jgi:mannose-6-phosphate isomerase-like protein (cupin superfamily)
MPWENSRQGRIKHLVNDKIDVRIASVDAYIQELSPGSRSGKHRHMAEEIIFILEGRGYDIHWDPNARMEDIFEWKLKEEVKYEWKEGDTVYIPMVAAHFISAQCRLPKYMGCPDFEQLEDALDYKL